MIGFFQSVLSMTYLNISHIIMLTCKINLTKKYILESYKKNKTNKKKKNYFHYFWLVVMCHIFCSKIIMLNIFYSEWLHFFFHLRPYWIFIVNWENVNKCLEKFCGKWNSTAIHIPFQWNFISQRIHSG